MIDRLQEEYVPGEAQAANFDVGGEDRWPQRFRFTDYFAGRVKGSGLFQDRFGKVRQEFTVDMAGEWSGEVFELREDFRLSDGRRQNRLWRVVKRGDGLYEAKADDIVGSACGKAEGRHMTWNYDLKVPVGDREIVLRFDDRMFLQPDGVLMNVSDARKFGVRIGRLVAFYNKIK